VSSRDFERWIGRYMTRSRLALFLDYDGTLTPLRDHPDEAVLSPLMSKALEACIQRDDIDVAIVSGRALDDIRKIVGYDGVTYAGNHGLEIAGHGISDFRHEDLVHYQERIDSLIEALEEVAVDGAWSEPKGPTLTYHYRKVPPQPRAELVARARTIITSSGFQARPAHDALEARPPIGWDKGQAVLHILRARYGPSWSEIARVIYVGDDQTDEDAFRFLSGLSMTFRVGPADSVTAATRRLSNVESVRALLAWLASRSG